jgi:predicted transcriptional regulator
MKRDRYEVTNEMLKIARKGCRKTEMMYRGYINYDMLNRYSKDMLENGLLVREGKRFKTSQKGLEFMRSFQNTKRLSGISI